MAFDSSGTLVLKNTIATGQEPFRIAVDPSGGFAYVANETGSVSIYALHSNGRLTSAGTAITPQCLIGGCGRNKEVAGQGWKDAFYAARDLADTRLR